MKTQIIIICCLHFVAAKDVPVIGILAQETFAVQKYFPEPDEDYVSFIAASYVKFVESAGAKVAPIWIGQNASYYQEVIKHTNGILLPGGATWFNESGGYGDAGQVLYDLALQANIDGTHYPIFGICLGMELLAQVAIDGEEIRAHCSAKKLSLPLEFEPGLNASTLFSSAPENVMDILKIENVTFNYHQYCLTKENFTAVGLDRDWRILATNKDRDGLEFISAFESMHYPFYGIQFHPEKDQFEFAPSQNIPHSLHAVEMAQYFANFFVEEARKNENSFDDWNDEQSVLIYNYDATFVGLANSSYEQIYVFKW